MRLCISIYNIIYNLCIWKSYETNTKQDTKNTKATTSKRAKMEKTEKFNPEKSVDI